MPSKINLRDSHRNVQTIDIYVGGGAGAKLFTAAASPCPVHGAHPGTVFTMKDKVDGNQLDEVRIGGPNCPA
jgi:hypothetical protein